MSTPRLSVSTWSLHRQLGKPGFTGPGHDMQIPLETHNKGPISLLELPAHIAEFGIHTLEICHFHLPSVEKSYLSELRAALADAEVELFSLLIDDGDITHPSEAERDIAWIEKWIDIAGELGAKCARVIGGKAAPSNETLAQSRRVLSQLTERADTAGIRVMSENWFSIFSTPENVSTILGGLEGKVGLCLDFGNWRGDTKYEDLAAIASWQSRVTPKRILQRRAKWTQKTTYNALSSPKKPVFLDPIPLFTTDPAITNGKAWHWSVKL